MITRNMMAGGSSASAVFEFKYTVTTNASGSSDKKSALPINLYGQTGVEISVDWGDGSTSVLKPSDYTASSSLASVHEYASAGTYQITASSSNWSDAYLLSCYADAAISSTNNANQPVYWWRRTLKSVDSPLPPVKGVMRLASASATSMTASDNDLGFLFHRCEKMTSIPANLFENAGHIEEFNSTFYNCVVLPSIPAGLFDPCVSALNFSDCFRYCLALTSIPVSFFKYCTAATNMYNVFRFCNKVTSVPADLFRYNTLVTNMGGAFSKCDALKNFQLCIGSPNVATVTDFILNASGVTRIVCVPANSTTYTSFNAYKNTSNNVTVSTSNADCGIDGDIDTEGMEYWEYTVNTEATNSGNKTASVPIDIIEYSDGLTLTENSESIYMNIDWGDGNNTILHSGYDSFSDDDLTTIHNYAQAGIYTVKIGCTDWSCVRFLFTIRQITGESTAYTSYPTFNENKIIYAYITTLIRVNTKIPVYSWSNSNSIGTYAPGGLFANCTKLASIPSNLFENYTSNNITSSFNYIFYNCTSLASIPSELFANISSVKYFTSTFNNCTSLASIPSELFNDCTSLISFSKCFHGCTSLASIPSKLFNNCTSVTEFSYCFQGCTSLVSIPSGLFDNNTAATRFDYCFSNCSSLQSIPSGLFDKNTAVTNFSSCFSGCTNLLNFHLKIGSSSVTNFSSFISDASNVDRILCVPADSTTYTNASSFASASNGVIVSTDIIDCAETWEFTIDTEATAAGEKKTGIPFNLYGQTGIKLLVDWGDNTTSTLTPSDYTASDSTASVHEYATAGEYTITVVSNNWENTYLLFYDSSISSDSYTKTSSLYWFKRTATSIDTKLPQIKGVANANTLTAYDNSLEYLFCYLEKLTSIPAGLFDKNTGVTSFDDCFEGCSSLQSIPAGLFDKNTAVTSFYYTFFRCSSLASIPSGLFDKNTAVTDFQACFSNCSSLASIPSGLFDKNTAMTTFYECFRDCSSLQSIPSGLFDKNTAVTRFDSCFQYCTSLQSIPSGLFDKNTAVTRFDYCFMNCTSLQSIPAGLFDKNTAVTSFSTCFRGCTSLLSIPAGLFDKNTAVTSFASCFSYCSLLQSIPSGLFGKNTAVTTLYTCFEGCTNLLNFHLKIGSSSVNTFSGFIPNASNVDRILCVPASSTTYTNASSFANASNEVIVSTTESNCIDYWEFTINTENKTQGEKTTAVPFNLYGQTGIRLIVDWGDNTTSTLTPSNYPNIDNSNASKHVYTNAGIYTVTVVSNDWENTYILVNSDGSNSNDSKAVAEYWFRKTLISVDTALPNVKGVVWHDIYYDDPAENRDNSFYSLFNNCYYLQSFPANLFANNPAVTDFDNCFSSCRSLTSIPSGLFDNNPAVTDFDNCFSSCRSLTSIPSGLFDNNTAATTFWQCFVYCTSLTSIPSGLFDNNTAVTNFGMCFRECPSLTSIPSGLFDNNTAVTEFRSCFSQCTSLASIPSGLFDNCTAATSFQGCFGGCRSLTSIPSGLFDNNTAVTTFYDCFYGCSSLASIPSGLFDKNTAATSFGYCFQNCSSIQSIPAGLFDKNTAVTTFSGCFKGCSALQSIPSGLFDKNTAVTTFSGCFRDCTSLQSIPSGLFDKNTAVTIINVCFNGCTQLTNFTLNIGSSLVTTVTDFVTLNPNATRTINVPTNSATYTAFSNVASSLGLTIVGV